MNRANANLLLLTAGAIWGGGFIAQATAMQNIGPVFFTGLRFAAAALTVLPLAIIEARRAGLPLFPAPRRSGRYVILGSLLFLSLAAQQIGLLTTTVTNSGFLTGLYVIITPMIGIAVWRIWPHPVIWPAAILSLGGIYLLSGGNLTALTVGDWLTVFCAFAWACHVQYLGRVVGDDRPFRLACAQFAVCAVLGILIAPFVETISLSMIPPSLGEILFAGIISGGIAFTIQVVAQRYTTAPQAAIFLSSEMLFAALFGAWLLGERIGPTGYAGCALIFLAMLTVEIVPMFRRKAGEPV
ncbi:DMT family transporter [Oricola sp.]|uniref:DMT family transporter n=1 Tax=Oricola sp. TaxID=1979950 RepID=UPI003BAA741C